MKFTHFMKAGSCVLAGLLITTHSVAQDNANSTTQATSEIAAPQLEKTQEKIQQELPYEEFSPTMKMKIEELEQEMKQEAVARMKNLQPAEEKKHGPKIK